MNANGIPSELLRSTPRAVRLTLGGYALAGLGALLLAGSVASAVGLTALARQGAARHARALREGIAAEGEVTGLGHVEEGKREVHYRYVAAGRSLEGSVEVDRPEWKDLEQGSRVPIRYLPSDPEQSWMPGHEPGGVPFFVPPLVAASCLAGASAIWYAMRAQRWLLEMGRPALATVTGHTRSQHGYLVKFEFKALSGARHTGSYEHSKKVQPGTTTVVLYHPDNPGRSRTYPFSFWRVD
jgi:hypothetical protein